MIAISPDFYDQTPQRRKITKQDLVAMAQLLAKRLTETGSCMMLGIKPSTWFKWKLKPHNQARFENMLIHVRESQLAGHLNNIESFQIKDWRASEALLRLKDPQRFGQRTEHSGEIKHTVGLSDDAMLRLIAMYNQNKQAVVGCPQSTVKEIIDCPVSE